jgi:hypothetical protein
MRQLFILLIFVLFTGCVQKTEYGPCIGIADDRNTNLIYKMHTGNAIVSILFIETIIVPIVWINDDFFCPIGVKNEQPQQVKQTQEFLPNPYRR